MVVESLQAKDDSSSRRAIQKPLHGLPERGQVWVGDAAPRNLYIGDTLLADHFIEDQQHLRVDDPADQQSAQQAAPREEMDQVVEQLLRLPIGRAVDDPLRVDDAVQPAQRIETALLEWEQAGGGSRRVGVHEIILQQSGYMVLMTEINSSKDLMTAQSASGKSPFGS